jgi:Tfp pilus assembly protein PilX
VRRPDLHTDEGSVLVISVVLMSVMLAVALSSFSFVDTGQRRAREQHERETSLNLSEAVLYSQGFALAQTWPGNAIGGAAMPTTCTSASVQSLCPNPNTLAAANSSSPASANFTNADASANVSWTTRIRDNGGPISDAFVLSQVDAVQTGTNVKTGVGYTCPGPCRWDANGDLMLWVQATAIVRGRTRNVVGLLKRERFSEAFARNAVTVGSFETSNNGNKTIVNALGSQIVVRCTSVSDPDPACTDYAKSQVVPSKILHDPESPPAMSATQLARFKAVAQSASPSTYYTSCPDSLAGSVVFIDVAPPITSCSDANGATYNSSVDPGIVIMPRGTLSMKSSFYGLVYMVNGQGSSGAVLTMGANGEIFGGVAIDGAGRLVAGQASGGRPTITFVPNAFNALATFGTTGLVQNTWRELPAS